MRRKDYDSIINSKSKLQMVADFFKENIYNLNQIICLPLKLPFLSSYEPMYIFTFVLDEILVRCQSFAVPQSQEQSHFRNVEVLTSVIFKTCPLSHFRVNGSVGERSTCSAGDTGSIPGSVRSLGEGNGNPLQYSCLGNPLDRGAYWVTVQGGD